MSEEEILDILENQISDYVIGDYCEKCDDNKICADRNEDCYFIQAIDGIIDLYQKEKEKNIKLANIIKSLNEEKERNKELLYEKESVFDKGYLEGTKDGEETIRDEIRAIIKDYYERKSMPDLVISRIEELLEEKK